MYDICRHLLMCPGRMPHDRQWVAFRALEDAGCIAMHGYRLANPRNHAGNNQ
ncbi:MAG: hypothetical protein KKC20_11530 [Proteobacteria bacterium]|nr:hypothetical protein [Pseudomonadota bacterium]